MIEPVASLSPLARGFPPAESRGTCGRSRLAHSQRGLPAAKTNSRCQRVGRLRVAAAEKHSVADQGSSVAAKALHQAQMVDFFRQASPYIAGHRSRTFVVVIPGELSWDERKMQSLMQDIALVHELGVRLVLVVGCSKQINEMLDEQGRKPIFTAGFRVTDEETMDMAMEAAGRVQLEISALLSRGPSVSAMRKHGQPARRAHGSAVRVISGNYVAAKRRGVVAGVDYGETGEVRHVDIEGITQRIDAGDIVLLTNLGYSAAGEVLNCPIWEVAAHAAVNVKADKLIVFARSNEGLVFNTEGEMMHWLPLGEAESYMDYCRQCRKLGTSPGPVPDTGIYPSLNPQPEGAEAQPQPAAAGGARPQETPGVGVMEPGSVSERPQGQGTQERKKAWPRPGYGRRLQLRMLPGSGAQGAGAGANGGPSSSSEYKPRGSAGAYPDAYPDDDTHFHPAAADHGAPFQAYRGGDVDSDGGDSDSGAGAGGGIGGSGSSARRPLSLSMMHWWEQGMAPELALAVRTCKAGVPRSHILDGGVEGAILLELYTCDGVGTMVSLDMYEGMRDARLDDGPHIAELLRPLELDGTLLPREYSQLVRDLPMFTVVERDGKCIGTAALYPHEDSGCAEVAAFAVHPRYRGGGRGDSLLDFLEFRAKSRGINKLFLLTTRTADWFEERGFRPAGRAYGNPLLPPRKKVDPSRNSKLFIKTLDGSTPAPFLPAIVNSAPFTP